MASNHHKKNKTKSDSFQEKKGRQERQSRESVNNGKKNDITPKLMLFEGMIGSAVNQLSGPFGLSTEGGINFSGKNRDT